MSDDDAGDDGGVDAHAEGDGDLASLCSGQDTSFVGSWGLVPHDDHTLDSGYD